MSTTKKSRNAKTWAQAAYHDVTLPSGSDVQIRIPDLPRMIETGEIPQHLLDAALGVANKPAATPSKELIVQQREFTDCLVKLTVTDPVLTPEDLPGIPYEDKEMIVEIATRQRDFDAEGNHIGGLDKSEKFRNFRGVSSLYSDVEGA